MAQKEGPFEEPYTFVHPDDVRTLERYADVLTNTGGNEPADLLNDLNGAAGDYFMSSNVVRFTLAVGIQSQLLLIKRLEAEGRL